MTDENLAAPVEEIAPVEQVQDNTPAEAEAKPEKLSLRETLGKAMTDAKEKQRDETGKFAKEKTQKTGIKEKAGDGQPADLSKPLKEAQTAETATQSVKPPNSLSAAAKAKWNSVPVEIQREISKREEEVQIGFTKMDEERNFGKQIQNIVQPYMAMMRAEGATPDKAIAEVLNTAYLLRTGSPQQKGKLLWDTARQFGADMSQVQQGNRQQQDPAFNQLTQRLQGLETTIQQQRQIQQQQEQAGITSTIEAFKNSPGHEHFEAVKQTMGSLLQNGIAKDLQDAYDRAIYASPEIRSIVLSAQQADQEKKRLSDQKAKADAARKAGSSVRGSAGMSMARPDVVKGSLRDQIKHHYREATEH